MFDGLKRIFGVIEVVEENGRIYIRGIHTPALISAIYQIWKTQRISTNMFVELTRSRIVIESFYGVELIYMLDKIQNYGSKLPLVTRRIAANLIEKLYEETWLGKTVMPVVNTVLDYSALDRFVYQPLPHQSEYYKLYNSNVQKYNLRGYMLGVAPGGGKTLMGLTLSEMYNVDAIIVLCPKNAIADPWLKSCSTLYKTPTTVWDSGSGEPIAPNKHVYVVHYDHLPKFVEHLKLFRNKRVSIVIDESHNLNEITAARTKALINMVKVIEPMFTLWMSGTPLKAMGTECIPLLSTIDPLFTPKAAESFKKIYGQSQAKGMDILSNRMGMVSYIVPKSAFMPDAPIITEVKVKIPQGEKYTLKVIGEEMKAFIQSRLEYYQPRMAEYRRDFYATLSMYERGLKTEKDRLEYAEYYRKLQIVINTSNLRDIPNEIMFVNRFELTKIIPTVGGEAGKHFKEIRTIVKYVSLKVRGECLGQILGKRRAECHVDMLPYVNMADYIDASAKKVLVFTSFVQVVEAAVPLLTSQGFKPLPVYGETNWDIKNIVTRFANEKEVNPLVATFKSLSTAVPLTMANTLLFLNSPFREYERNQTIARAHRIGQDHPVYVYDFFLDTGDEPNISTRSKDILAWSESQVNSMLGLGDMSTVEGTESFYATCISDTLNDLVQPDSRVIQW